MNKFPFIYYSAFTNKKKKIFTEHSNYTFAFGSLNLFLHLAPIFFHSEVLFSLQWYATHTCSVLFKTVRCYTIHFDPYSWNPYALYTCYKMFATNRWKRFIATMRTYSTKVYALNVDIYKLCYLRKHTWRQQFYWPVRIAPSLGRIC